MGGQTALNLCIDVDEKGIWEKYNVDIIGVDIDAIHITEDREQFRKLMNKIDIPVAPAKTATSFLKGKEIAQEFGFPLVIRPSFTLGGSGGGIAYNLLILVVHSQFKVRSKITWVMLLTLVLKSF
mgnify:CR=1 FL=1